MAQSKPALTFRDNEVQGDLARWLREQSGDNSERLERLRRNIRRAREAELTQRQREMLYLYYDRGHSMTRIAMELAVNKSPVSRTLARARRRLYRCLKYSL